MNTTAVVGNTKEKEPIVHATTRHSCPFYGFVGMARMLVDCHGNGCGVAGGHRPCAMEMAHEVPNWNECKRFNYGEKGTQFEFILDQYKVLPEELKPHDSVAWEGVSLRGWYHLIMRE